jgi:16S rRNA (uracil1498-N3)-methyltransferase
MSERFYINLPLTLGTIQLDGVEAHHLATVCRLRPGSEVCLFNGDGRQYQARITAVARREVTLEIVGIEQPERELPFALEVAAPLPKGDRSQFLLEKLTEVGVTQFVPLVCHYSNTHPRDNKRDKLERYVIEASKQCGRNVLMKIDELTTWENYVQRSDDGELRILAHPVATTCERKRPYSADKVRIAVGPEGGFTDDEVALALQNGWHTVSLGPRILRVETAALVLASSLSVREAPCEH